VVFRLTRSTVEALRRASHDRPPVRAFAGTSREDFRRWRRASIARLQRIYRLQREAIPRLVRVVRSAQRDGYRCDYLTWTAPDGVEVPAYLLVPSGSGPFPAFVFLHGHGATIEQVLGFADPEPGTSDGNLAYLRSLRWVESAPQAGYVCLVPEHRGFGALSEAQPGCQHAFLNALAFGRTLQGMRVADVIRWIDFLRTRDDVERDRIAVGGISLGGELAVLVSAFDTRVSATVTAGFVRILRDQLHQSAFCPCSYAPDLFDEFDLPEIAGLIAPRPLLVQSGDHDGLYPRECAEEGIRRVREIYAIAGARADYSFFPGLHEFDGAGALDWLNTVSPFSSSPSG